MLRAEVAGAALERAERERDEEALRARGRLVELGECERRAKKAERALAETEQALMIAAVRLAGDEVGIDQAQAIYDECLALAALRGAPRSRSGKFDPDPPRLLVDANGYVWRDYGEHYSMCPVNPDNEPIKQPVTYYEPAQLVYDQSGKNVR